MSQNKTITSEFEYDNPKPAYTDSNPMADLYKPSGNVSNSTVIAGSEVVSTNNMVSTTPMTPVSPISKSIHLQERVIIGVLFSISRGLLGEIYPVYLGRNAIGSSPACDICLSERTVSEEHAVLFARSDGYPAECHVTLTDYGSMQGSTVNQQDCRYETLKVLENDIISIGAHYKLVLKLFNASVSGLYENGEFENMSSATNISKQKSTVTNDFYAPSGNGNNETRTVIG